MDKIIKIGLIGIAVLFFSCDKNEEKNTTLKIGEVTEMKLGETVENSQKGLSLRMDKLNDSRCPTGAICCWQGVATVKFHLKTKEGEHDFTLEKFGLEGGRSSEGVVIEGLKYYIVDVLPYPVVGKEQSVKTVKILVGGK